VLRRIAPLLVAVSLVATACNRSQTAATTTSTSTSTIATTSTTSTTVVAAPVFEVPTYPDDDVRIEPDPDVEIGELENGLTYYIRQNRRPGRQVQLRLAIKAGSAVEDRDQRGVAHYLEHMLFNGTESFPANELIKVLERFGAEFGPDVNAFTSYDQTVYELTLPNDDEILETALDVLLEWAAKATIDPTEVANERGVLLEEWRVRSQTYFGRYAEAVVPVLLAGTPYEGHDPLADPAELQATTAETLRRFYEDWYRPDLMAVIAVGDFDTNEVRDMITERFGSLQNPVPARPLPDLATSPAAEPAFVRLPDPESPDAYVELNWPSPAPPEGTIGTFRRQLAMDVAWDALVRRLQEDAISGLVPYFAGSFAANPFVDGQSAPGIAAFSEPTELDPTARSLLEEVRRVILHGFSESEVDISIELIRNVIEAEFRGRATKQDGEYAAEYLDNFLIGAPVPAAATALDLQSRLLDEMTPDQVAETFRAVILSTSPLVIVGAPSAEAASIPTESRLEQIVTAAANATVPARPTESATITELMERPDPAPVADRLPLRPGVDIEIIEFGNGVRVAAVETDIESNVIRFEALSPGGWLLVPPADAVEAQLASELILSSGVGGYSQVALSRFLSNESVGVVPYIGPNVEGLFGEAEVEDLELMFQLIHLYMTEPQADPQAAANLVSQYRALAADPDSDPFDALGNAYARLRFGDERFQPIPALSSIVAFDVDRSLAAFRQRFSDGDDFVFVFAGDFDRAELESLAASYLGTLPVLNSSESTPASPPEPSGILSETVEAGEGELGVLWVVFEAPLTLDEESRLVLPVLESVLNQRLTALLRERLAATYSPFVTVDLVEEPDPHVGVFFQVSGDPAGLDLIFESLLADLADLRLNGPTPDELSIAVEQLTLEYEFVTNFFWLDLLLRYARDLEADLGEVDRRITGTRLLATTDVRNLATRVLEPDEFITLKLVPEG
jgi:zinc protease